MSKLGWFDKKYVPKVIGSKGENIERICQQSGAKISIKNDGSYILKGSTVEVENANSMIRQIISSSHKPKGSSFNFIQKGTSSDFIRKGASSRASQVWKEVDFVTPNDFGRVIGKERRNIKSLEKTHNVKLHVDSRINKLLIQGPSQNRKRCLKDLQNFLKNPYVKYQGKQATRQVKFPIKEGSSEKVFDGRKWEAITWFKPEYFSKILGKDGGGLKRLQEQYHLQISVDNEVKVLKVAGVEENKKKFEEFLCDVMVSPQNKHIRKGISRNEEKRNDEIMDAFL